MVDPDAPRCTMSATYGQPGSTRLITGCPNDGLEEIDGQYYCQQHADAHRYQMEQFRSAMVRSTRHFRQIGIHGKGVHCGCGTFVKEGDVHPWGVPTVVEKQINNLLERKPLDTWPPTMQEAINACLAGSSHHLLDDLADECDALDRELR